MPADYGPGARELQDRYDTRRLADRLDERFFSAVEITPERRAFIEAQPMFFLATADADGRPQCSYKGGDPGFVRVLGPDELCFPNYDGNGMYLSLGNLAANPHVGPAVHRLPGRPAEPAADLGRGVDRPGGPAGRDLPGRPVRRPRAGDRGVPQLPALHPPDGAGGAVALRPGAGRLGARAGLEAHATGPATCCPRAIRRGPRSPGRLRAAMDLSKLRSGEIAAAIGGIMLVIAVFLPAYSPSRQPERDRGGLRTRAPRRSGTPRTSSGSCCCWPRSRRSSSSTSSSAATSCPGRAAS